MEPESLSKEELKDLLYALRMMNANMENWKYVSANAEYLDKKQVADSLSQVISQFDGFLPVLQSVFELQALTTLDPSDLI